MQDRSSRLGRRRFVAGAAASLAFGGAIPRALAQDDPWPSRAVRVVVPFPAGSAADATGRIVMETLARRLGQPMVIDNRPGGAGVLGSSLVAHAKPDGYTLLVHSSSHTITPAVSSGLNFDPAADLAGITTLSFTSTVFVASAAKGYRTLDDLVTAARAKPGSINYASSGAGTVTHLAAVSLSSAAGFRAVHIPYKGSGEAISDLLAGRVDYFLSPVSIVLPMIRSGQLVALATVDAKRSRQLPETPTTAECGYPSVSFAIWMGLFAPARTPQAILDRINTETNAVLRMPEVRARIEQAGAAASGTSRGEFASLLATEFERNAALVKSAGIKAE